MSYAKRTWVNGEVITAEKLNHMEDGIEGAGGGDYDAVVNISNTNSYATAIVTAESGTYADIAALIEDGTPPKILVKQEFSENRNSISSNTSVVYYAPGYTTPMFVFVVLMYHVYESDFIQISLAWDAEDNLWWN